MFTAEGIEFRVAGDSAAFDAEWQGLTYRLRGFASPEAFNGYVLSVRLRNGRNVLIRDTNTKVASLVEASRTIKAFAETV